MSTRRLIVAFCQTNVALVDENKELFDAISSWAGESGGSPTVRIIRCLTKCHTCGEVSYVKVGNDVLERPTLEELKSKIEFSLTPTP